MYILHAALKKIDSRRKMLKAVFLTALFGTSRPYMPTTIPDLEAELVSSVLDIFAVVLQKGVTVGETEGKSVLHKSFAGPEHTFHLVSIWMGTAYAAADKHPAVDEPHMRKPDARQKKGQGAAARAGGWEVQDPCL
jgi:hypothetical protein